VADAELDRDQDRAAERRCLDHRASLGDERDEQRQSARRALH
jgi:hypothetical protein